MHDVILTFRYSLTYAWLVIAESNFVIAFIQTNRNKISVSFTCDYVLFYPDYLH